MPLGQVESGALLQDSIYPSRIPLRFPLEASCRIESIPSLSGHLITCRFVRELKSSGTGPEALKVALLKMGVAHSGKPMDQLMFALFSRTHNWYRRRVRQGRQSQ